MFNFNVTSASQILNDGNNQQGCPCFNTSYMPPGDVLCPTPMIAFCVTADKQAHFTPGAESTLPIVYDSSPTHPQAGSEPASLVYTDRSVVASPLNMVAGQMLSLPAVLPQSVPLYPVSVVVRPQAQLSPVSPSAGASYFEPQAQTFDCSATKSFVLPPVQPPPVSPSAGAYFEQQAQALDCSATKSFVLHQVQLPPVSPSAGAYFEQAQALDCSATKSFAQPVQTAFSVRSSNVRNHFHCPSTSGKEALQTLNNNLIWGVKNGSSHEDLPRPELAQIQESSADELENVPAVIPPYDMKKSKPSGLKMEAGAVVSSPKKKKKKKKKKKSRNKNSTAPPTPPANLNTKVNRVKDATKELEETFMGRMEKQDTPILYRTDTQRQLEVRKGYLLENLCKNLEDVDKEAKLEKIIVRLDQTERSDGRLRTRGLKVVLQFSSIDDADAGYTLYRTKTAKKAE